MVAGQVAMASLGALYSAGRLMDGKRYWDAYYRNTGFRPRYPFRAMSSDITPALYFGNSLKSVSRSGSAQRRRGSGRRRSVRW